MPDRAWDFWFAAASGKVRAMDGMTHKVLQPPGWPRPKGYSSGISARGRMIFTAGIVGWDETERFREETLHGQFAQALRNTLAILAQDGAGREHVVRMTAYVIDRAEYLSSRDEIGAAWKSIMGSHYPAMALVEVKGLVESAAKIEIETTAVVPE
jgi:enamine deaminase RidA (YjgF/YER057c/UK114 family)